MDIIDGQRPLKIRLILKTSRYLVLLGFLSKNTAMSSYLLNSTAVAAPTQPPDPSQLPSPPPFSLETNSPAPLSPTTILRRWCQNSHRLLHREENHPPRHPMSFQSNMLAWIR
ncbi:hypothetical protein Bca4012_024817 [Brassica carinata]